MACGMVQSSLMPGKFLSMDLKKLSCWAGFAGMAPYRVSSSGEATSAVRALKASSGCLVVLSRLKVSAWSLAGVTAHPNCLTFGLAGAAVKTQHVNHVCDSFIARLPDSNSLPLSSRSLLICALLGMKWSFQTPSLNHFSPVRTESGITAVLPSSETRLLPPQRDASARGLLSAYCMSKPHWTTFVGSKLELVASLPAESTVSFMARSRSVSTVQSLPWYLSPTFVGGYGTPASSKRSLLKYINDG